MMSQLALFFATCLTASALNAENPNGSTSSFVFRSERLALYFANQNDGASNLHDIVRYLRFVIDPHQEQRWSDQQIAEDIQWLSGKGGSVLARDDLGFDALQVASQAVRVGVVKQLLELGATQEQSIALEHKVEADIKIIMPALLVMSDSSRSFKPKLEILKMLQENDSDGFVSVDPIGKRNALIFFCEQIVSKLKSLAEDMNNSPGQTDVFVYVFREASHWYETMCFLLATDGFTDDDIDDAKTIVAAFGFEARRFEPATSKSFGSICDTFLALIHFKTNKLMDQLPTWDAFEHRMVPYVTDRAVLQLFEVGGDKPLPPPNTPAVSPCPLVRRRSSTEALDEQHEQHIQDAMRDSRLHNAVRDSNNWSAEEIRWLIEEDKANIFARCPCANKDFGLDALQLACRYNNADAVEILLEKGASQMTSCGQDFHSIAPSLLLFDDVVDWTVIDTILKLLWKDGTNHEDFTEAARGDLLFVYVLAVRHATAPFQWPAAYDVGQFLLAECKCNPYSPHTLPMPNPKITSPHQRFCFPIPEVELSSHNIVEMSKEPFFASMRNACLDSFQLFRAEAPIPTWREYKFRFEGGRGGGTDFDTLLRMVESTDGQGNVRPVNADIKAIIKVDSSTCKHLIHEVIVNEFSSLEHQHNIEYVNRNIKRKYVPKQLQIVLAKGGDPLLRDENGYNALQLACLFVKPEHVKILLQEADDDYQSQTIDYQGAETQPQIYNPAELCFASFPEYENVRPTPHLSPPLYKHLEILKMLKEHDHHDAVFAEGNSALSAACARLFEVSAAMNVFRSTMHIDSISKHIARGKLRFSHPSHMLRFLQRDLPYWYQVICFLIENGGKPEDVASGTNLKLSSAISEGERKASAYMIIKEMDPQFEPFRQLQKVLLEQFKRKKHGEELFSWDQVKYRILGTKLKIEFSMLLPDAIVFDRGRWLTEVDQTKKTISTVSARRIGRQAKCAIQKECRAPHSLTVEEDDLSFPRLHTDLQCRYSLADTCDVCMAAITTTSDGCLQHFGCKLCNFKVCLDCFERDHATSMQLVRARLGEGVANDDTGLSDAARRILESRYGDLSNLNGDEYFVHELISSDDNQGVDRHDMEWAIKHGKKANEFSPDHEDLNALQLACRRSDPQFVEFLISKGINQSFIGPENHNRYEGAVPSVLVFAESELWQYKLSILQRVFDQDCISFSTSDRFGKNVLTSACEAIKYSLDTKTEDEIIKERPYYEGVVFFLLTLVVGDHIEPKYLPNALSIIEGIHTSTANKSAVKASIRSLLVRESKKYRDQSPATVIFVANPRWREEVMSKLTKAKANLQVKDPTTECNALQMVCYLIKTNIENPSDWSEFDSAPYWYMAVRYLLHNGLDPSDAPGILAVGQDPQSATEIIEGIQPRHRVTQAIKRKILELFDAHESGRYLVHWEELKNEIIELHPAYNADSRTATEDVNQRRHLTLQLECKVGMDVFVTINGQQVSGKVQAILTTIDRPCANQDCAEEDGSAPLLSSEADGSEPTAWVDSELQSDLDPTFVGKQLKYRITHDEDGDPRTNDFDRIDFVVPKTEVRNQLASARHGAQISHFLDDQRHVISDDITDQPITERTPPGACFVAAFDPPTETYSKCLRDSWSYVYHEHEEGQAEVPAGHRYRQHPMSMVFGPVVSEHRLN